MDTRRPGLGQCVSRALGAPPPQLRRHSQGWRHCGVLTLGSFKWAQVNAAQCANRTQQGVRARFVTSSAPAHGWLVREHNCDRQGLSVIAAGPRVGHSELHSARGVRGWRLSPNSSRGGEAAASALSPQKGESARLPRLRREAE